MSPSIPRCSGLIVELGFAEGEDPRTLKLAARRAVRRCLKGRWRIDAVSEGRPEFLVRPAEKGRSLPGGRAWDLARELALDRDVRSVEPLFRTTGLEPATRRELGGLEAKGRLFGRERVLPCARHNPIWSLERVRAQEAWQKKPGPGGKSRGAGIVIGHPDTGYTRHPEIWQPTSKPRVLAKQGYDYEDENRDPKDPLIGRHPGHGTSTASVIMSDHNPRDGGAWVSGIAPRAQLIPLRVSDSVVHFDFSNVTRAIHRCVDQGAHVISMSLGGPIPSAALERAIDRALDEGIIVLAAAGNVWPWVVYPARYEQVLAVAAVNCEGKPWSDSASGSCVDIAAPGESVWRARRVRRKNRRAENRVEPSSGTSYAVATTAGACALWLAQHGRLDLIARYGPRGLPAVFRELLLTRGFERPHGWPSRGYGVGILRIDRLLAARLPHRPPAKALAAKTPLGRRRTPDPVTLLQDYLPGLGREQLRKNLARELGVRVTEMEPILDDHGDELILHVATNPDLRQSLRAGRRRRGARLAKARSVAKALPPSRLSKSLRNRLGE